jgi:hypothetical protein
MPKELAQDSVIHAYMVKSGVLNASMWPFGIITVNVGLFDEVPTEAALAGVLTHELAHYYLKHAMHSFIKEYRGDFERVFGGSSRSKFSVQHELQADSLAIVWMTNAGYGLNGILDAFKSIQRRESNQLLKMQNVWELEESTHPNGVRRLALVDSFARKNPAMMGSDFLVSINQFYNLKELAKPEILQCLLNNFQYDLCIEKAFKFHILDPEKPEYVYYLMEGIRRKCYLNSDFWKKDFLVDSYFQIVESKSGRRKVRRTDPVFKKIPDDILCMREEDVKSIKADFYWSGTPKFQTYEEAFNFYYEVGKVYKEPECVLSNALSVNFDPQARNTLLKKYLAFENVKYRDFAEKLLNGTIQTGLPGKTLTLLSDFNVIVKEGSDRIYLRNEKLGDDNKLTPLLEAAASGMDRRKCLNLSSLQQARVNDYIMFQQLKVLALTPIVAKGEKTELHILDPRFWQLMQKYQVNEVEFVDVNYHDVRKTDNTLESYKKFVQTNRMDLLSEVKRDRYVEVRIAAIREMPESVMKLLKLGMQEKAPYSQSGKEATIDFLNLYLKQKDKEAAKPEYNFKPGKD